MNAEWPHDDLQEYMDEIRRTARAMAVRHTEASFALTEEGQRRKMSIDLNDISEKFEYLFNSPQHLDDLTDRIRHGQASAYWDLDSMISRLMAIQNNLRYTLELRGTL